MPVVKSEGKGVLYSMWIMLKIFGICPRRAAANGIRPDTRHWIIAIPRHEQATIPGKMFLNDGNIVAAKSVATALE